uniref:uncharacterized protein n=1 Tax=Myxine glutinosa TaxID=7769 RepID=UPI0035902E33
MAETEDFLEWLQAQGLRAETAFGVITELGIESQTVLRVCTESALLRSELYSLLKEKFAFAMYAEVRCFVESQYQCHGSGLANLVLVDVLCSMLNAVSQEFTNCVQKLRYLVLHSDDADSDGLEQKSTAENFSSMSENICTFLPQQERSATSEPSMAEMKIEHEEDEGLCGELQPDVEETNGSTCTTKGLPVNVKVEPDSVDYSTAKDSCLEKASNPEQPDLMGRMASSCMDVPSSPLRSIRQFSCSRCSQSFNNEVALEQHMERHPLGSHHKKYKCSHCPYSCDIKSKLCKHMAIHTGVKPFTCSICGKGFSISGYKRKHMRIHTGAQQFLCLFCTKPFTHSSALWRHMRIHTGIRPYKCLLCGKTFHRSDDLQNHKQRRDCNQRSNEMCLPLSGKGK